MIKTLYGLDKKGGYKVWEISALPFPVSRDDETACIVISHGKEGGKLTLKTETISKGKQGRTPLEQAISEAEGRIKKQMDKGYRESKDELQDLDVLAMLAADYRKQGHRVIFPCYGSVKYDGVRALAKKRNGVVTLESRTSQPYDVPHIIEMLTIHMQDGDIWDGELYVHGYALQDITSAVKRTDTQGEIDKCKRKINKHDNDPNGSDQAWHVKWEELQKELDEAELIHELRPKLEFHIFDVVTDQKFIDRVKLLDELCGIPVVSPCIQITQYLWIADAADMKVKHDEAVNAGYEGLMLRNFCGLYESGKRSADLQKYKEFLDSEFLIRDIIEDKQGNAVFVLENDIVNIYTGNKDLFQCVMGDMAERKHYIENKHLYIGKVLTVKYQSRYKGTMLPQFPTGVAIRDYE